jgi:hypothetical protein
MMNATIKKYDRGRQGMIVKIPLGGITVRDLCMLTTTEPALVFARDLGLKKPPAFQSSYNGPPVDTTTYWGG